MTVARRNRRITSRHPLILLILLVFGPSAGSAYAQTQPQNPLEGKNILILHAFEANMPMAVKTVQGLITSLDGGGLAVKNQFYESLDLARHPDPEHRRRLVELLRQRYGDRKIDLIVTTYADALQFVLNEGATLFPNAPVLATYLPSGLPVPRTDRRIIPHSMSLDMKGTLRAALGLVPGAKRVWIVSDVFPGHKQYELQARRDFKEWEDRLEFRYLSDMPLEGMLAAVSSAPPGTVVIYIAVLRDVTGKVYTPRDVAQRMSRVSTAPIFGLYDTLLGYGIGGGSIASHEAVGIGAGRLALKILGDPQGLEHGPATLEIPPVPMFDWRQLRHWNLDEGALPEGSIVINKEITFWDFKYYIIGALVFIIGQSFLIIGLLAQKRRRRSAEESLFQKTEELDQFFNISLDLLCIANIDGYFLRLNLTWEKVLGYSRQELMAKPFLEFVHPEDLGKTQETVSALASQSKLISFKNRYRCRDGTYRWLDWTAAPAGNIIHAVARDVTEHKLAEEALQERLQFQQLLSDLSARFVNISPDRVDSEIEHGLRQIIEFFQVDRAGLVRTLPGRSGFQITHAAYSEDVPPVPAGAELPISLYPWAYEKLIFKREVVAYSRLDDLPPEAIVDKQTWTDWGIRSNVNIPILIGEHVDHIIAINSVKSERVWPEELFPRLQLLGEIFVNALERRQGRLQLEERLREIENLKQRLENENIYLQEEVKLLVEHSEIVGQSSAIKHILAQAEQVAPTDSMVLILGETGTGKELLARAIHRMSSCKDRPLITVNCASLPPTLIENELFGREKGAYTGALTKMVGRFELADGSTLFLDEIGELPLELQSKLLRVLEEGKFERLGSTKTLHVNVRIIAATNRDIAQDVTEGKFRKDLYYRLNVFPITIPPLRERPEDIPLLAWAFIREFEKKIGKPIDSIPRKSMEALQQYSWPGNVRELRNVIEHSMIVSTGETLNVRLPRPEPSEISEPSKLESIERAHLLSVLNKTNWRIAGERGAAEILGLKRTTLLSLLKRLGITRPTH